MTTPAVDMEHSCKNCLHHRKERRDKLVDMVFDTIAELDDKEVFMCAAPSGPWKDREVGELPILCEAWQVQPPKQTSQADALVERALARLASRSRKSDGDRE